MRISAIELLLKVYFGCSFTCRCLSAGAGAGEGEGKGRRGKGKEKEREREREREREIRCGSSLLQPQFLVSWQPTLDSDAPIRLSTATGYRY